MTPTKRSILQQIERAGDCDAALAALASAMEAGFDGVEIAMPGIAGSPAAPIANADSGVIAVAAVCRSTDVTCGLAEVSALLSQAANCRATCLNLTLPPIDGQDGGAGFARYQDGLNFAYRVLYDLRYEAESTGVAIALEAADGAGLLSPVELREIINQANSPAVGVCLDVARVSRVGVALDWIATLGNRIKSLRVELDHGELDPLANALDAAGYDGPVMVRGTADPDRLRAAVARLASGPTHVT